MIYNKDFNVTVGVNQYDGLVELHFEADIGKFGTSESVAAFTISPKDLLHILSENAKHLKQ